MRKQGLVWKDVRPILSEFKSRQDFMRSATQPKVFFNRVAAAGGPVAQKLLLVKLRPKLEPVLKKWSVKWEVCAQPCSRASTPAAGASP